MSWAYVLAGGIIGFFSSLGTAILIDWRKNIGEMRQRVYEPLRQELESNFHTLERAEKHFMTKEWDRVNREEYWSFKIRPEKLRKGLGDIYGVKLPTLSSNINAVKNHIIELVEKHLNIKLDDQSRQGMWGIADDLATHQNNLQLWKTGNCFKPIKEKYGLKYPDYSDFRNEMIKILDKEELLKHFWRKRSSDYKYIRKTINQLKKNLGMKEEQFSL